MAMTRNNLSPLAWYTDKSMQGFRRSYAYGRQFPNGAPMHRLLPFQIVVTTDTALSVSSVVLEYVDGGRIDITADIKLAGLSTHDYISGYGYEVVVFPALTDWLSRETPVAGNDTTALHEGFACLHLTLTGGSSPAEYWSEVMALIPSMYGYLQVAWSSLTDVIFEGGRIVYEDAPSYVNRLWLRTEVGMPEYEQSDEGEDRNGFFFATKQTSEKTYHMNFVATEEMCDALRIAGLSDVVTVIDPDGRTYNCDTFLMTPKWQEQGYLASVDCEFQTDTVVVRPANSTSLTTVTPKFYNASGGGITYLALDGQSGSTQISVSPYFNGTTVTSNVSWLVVSVNGGQLTLTRTKNDTGTSRTATITAKTPYGKTATLSVSQSKAVSLPSITQTSLSVAKTGGSYTINIVDPDNVGWKLTCGTGALNNGGTTLTGSGTTAVSVTYPANTTSAAIDDTITLSSTDEAYSEDYDALLVVREASESKHKFSISSVTPASASVYINGVETKSAEIAEGGTIVVTAKASGYDDYSANYTMGTSDMSRTISMTKTATIAASISPTSVSLAADEASATFTVKDPDSHGWSIDTGSTAFESWAVTSGSYKNADKYGVSGGSGAAVVVATIGANSDTSSRSRSFTFTDSTTGVKTTVTITQAAYVVPSHTFKITSVTPSGATVKVNGSAYTIGDELKFEEGASITVTATADGYKDYTAAYTMGTSDMSVTVPMTAEAEKKEPSISPTSVSLAASGTDATFIISDPDSQGWSIEAGSGSFESFSVTSGSGTGGNTGVSGGSGDSTVKVVLKTANISSSARTHTFTFTGTGANKTTVTITQAAKIIQDPSVSFDDGSVTAEVGASGGSVAITVLDPDNVGWGISAGDGVTFSGESFTYDVDGHAGYGTGEKSLTVTVTANTSTSEKEIEIFLMSQDGDTTYTTLTITQATAKAPSMTLTYGSNTGLSSASIPRTETQVTVVVTDSDNVGWYITPDSGITLSDVSASELQTGSKSITATVAANTSTSQKTLHIYLLSEDGDTLYTTLTLTQAAVPTYTFKITSVSPTGATITVNNSAYTVGTSLTFNSGSSVTVKATATGYDDYSKTYTISSDTSDTISMTASNPSWDLTDQTLDSGAHAITVNVIDKGNEGWKIMTGTHTITSGTGDTTYTYNLSANTSTTSITNTIKLTSSDGSQTFASATITQAAKG